MIEQLASLQLAIGHSRTYWQHTTCIAVLTTYATYLSQLDLLNKQIADLNIPPKASYTNQEKRQQVPTNPLTIMDAVI